MRQPSRGICTLCQGAFSKPSMARHLEICRQKVKEQASQQQWQKISTFHLVVEGSRFPLYWLHLEVATSTTLEVLDQFLRAIWLECCGHLSAFKIGNVHYCEDEQLFDGEGWHGRKQPLQVALEQVLQPGQTGTYDYDFGSTTELTLKVLAAREVKTQGMAIRILARNMLPPIPCDGCGKPATSACKQCLDEDHEQGYLCEMCAETHACEKEMVVRLRRVNSPRAGVCSYVGSTDPASR